MWLTGVFRAVLTTFAVNSTLKLQAAVKGRGHLLAVSTSPDEQFFSSGGFCLVSDTDCLFLLSAFQITLPLLALTHRTLLPAGLTVPSSLHCGA